jgi:hypothetical protein
MDTSSEDERKQPIKYVEVSKDVMLKYFQNTVGVSEGLYEIRGGKCSVNLLISGTGEDNLYHVMKCWNLILCNSDLGDILGFVYTYSVYNDIVHYFNSYHPDTPPLISEYVKTEDPEIFHKMFDTIFQRAKDAPTAWNSIKNKCSS